MDTAYFIAGLLIVAIFSVLLVRNSHRQGILHAILRVDTILGIVAGVALMISSIAG